MKKKNIALITICIVLVVSSYVVGSMSGGEFGGADDQIETAVKEIDANYEPWFNSLWEPPSGEIESLLFAFQAALGGAFIGYYIGKKQSVKGNSCTIKEQQTVQ